VELYFCTQLPLAGLSAIYLIAPFGAGLAHVGADLAGLASACAVSLASASIATALVTVSGVPLGYFSSTPIGSRDMRVWQRGCSTSDRPGATERSIWV
jgi:hypothetical protein